MLWSRIRAKQGACIESRQQHDIQETHTRQCSVVKPSSESNPEKRLMDKRRTEKACVSFDKPVREERLSAFSADANLVGGAEMSKNPPHRTRREVRDGMDHRRAGALMVPSANLIHLSSSSETSPPQAQNQFTFTPIISHSSSLPASGFVLTARSPLVKLFSHPTAGSHCRAPTQNTFCGHLFRASERDRQQTSRRASLSLILIHRSALIGITS